MFVGFVRLCGPTYTFRYIARTHLHVPLHCKDPSIRSITLQRLIYTFSYTARTHLHVPLLCKEPLTRSIIFQGPTYSFSYIARTNLQVPLYCKDQVIRSVILQGPTYTFRYIANTKLYTPLYCKDPLTRSVILQGPTYPFICIKQDGLRCNVPSLYSWGSLLGISRDSYYPIEVFLSPSYKCRYSTYPKLGQHYFFPQPFQFIFVILHSDAMYPKRPRASPSNPLAKRFLMKTRGTETCK